MTKTIRSVKGTRDFYPCNMIVHNWLYEHIRRVSNSYGFQQWDGPVLETIELYAAKSGDELVKEQAFVFEDRGGSFITLRPELTPSLARMVAKNRNSLNMPLRWWSFGRFWRYERPQKGRAREFFQWNLDLIGSNSIRADAEVASIAAQFFYSIGFVPKDIVIKVNNRQFMEKIISDLGVLDNQFDIVFRLIDRVDKMSSEKWMQYASDVGLKDVQINKLHNELCKVDQWRDSEELSQFFEFTEMMGTRQWFEFDPKVVRGLDYYTGIVFEARDRKLHHRALLGGGRYDNLVSDMGGDAISGTGFAMGDVVIKLLVEEFGLLPDINTSNTDILITIFEEDLISYSYEVASELRKHNFAVEVYPDIVKLKKQLKYADRQNIAIVLVLGPDEIANSMVTVKKLSDGSQTNILLADLPEVLRTMLESE
ncbi:MAG TPA: histidine--tRNA ligase [Chloroflexi bacterium]|nr:histidine--tRNA ligase [Chloroflexota bacterium]